MFGEDRSGGRRAGDNSAKPQPDGVQPEQLIIGHSVEKRPIRASLLGKGERSVILIGGIHGGYEWNTVLLARLLLGHFEEHPGDVPEGYTLSIIPNMNPDGLHEVTGGRPLEDIDFSGINTAPGRFNARGVDLNRNWDSRWQPTSYWGHRVVDAGESPFSEPETRAVRDYILSREPELVIFFQSAADGIWYGGKQDRWEPALRFAETYSEASGYTLPEGTEGPVSYEITGSASGYLYTQGIPTLTIELTTHSSPEFERNLAGVTAVFDMLGE